MAPGVSKPGTTTTVWGRPVWFHSVLTNPWDSDASTFVTCRILQRYARQYAGDASVRLAVLDAVRRLPAGASQRDIACAIFHWVRSRIRFREDEDLLYNEVGVHPANLDKELLIVPPVLLGMPQPCGDCDDFSLLVASMCLAAGMQPFYVTVAADPTDTGKLSHIYVCVRLADERGYLCLDAGNRYPSVPAGWESATVSRKAIWAI